MYMRIENNYINKLVIEQKIEEGILTYFMKNRGPPPNPNAKVKMLVQMDGRFSQKAGQPPPPELAPPPKPVNEVMPMQPKLSPQLLMTMQQKVVHYVMLQVQGAIRPSGALNHNQAGNAAQRGATDRSRTPVPAPASKAGLATKPAEAALPYPWEEHWSDKYSIAYFWNSKTGESAWEKPVA